MDNHLGLSTLLHSSFGLFNCWLFIIGLHMPSQNSQLAGRIVKRELSISRNTYDVKDCVVAAEGTVLTTSLLPGELPYAPDSLAPLCEGSNTLVPRSTLDQFLCDLLSPRPTASTIVRKITNSCQSR